MNYVYLVYLSEPWKDYLETVHATASGAQERVEWWAQDNKKAYIVKMELED